MTDQREVSWTPPGPGPWELETAHYARPLPRFGADVVPRGMIDGFSEGSARYGLLLSHFEVELVNGFWYQQPAPFGAPKGAKGPPPAPILWLLTRLHPGMRKRIAACERAFADRLWREDLRRWDEVDRPAALRRHEELLATDLREQDDRALAAHLCEAAEHLGKMVMTHHRYTIPSILPVGDLLAHVAEWTGDAPGKTLSMLRGTTPVSTGILASELEELAAAVRASADAKAALAGTEPRDVIEGLSGRDDEVGAAARAFFERIRHRAVSYEVAAKAAGEMPELLVGAVRSAVAKPASAAKDESAARIREMRGRVPAEHRARFDELVEEARVVNRLRDERGVYADGFAVGIARRALLEAGRRLAERGALRDPEHAVDLSLDEVGALLEGRPGPTADDVLAHVTWRRTKTVDDAPPFLGGQPGAPPDANLLPGAARRATRAVDAVLTNLFKEAEPAAGVEVVRGLSVNEGVYEGTARLIAEPSEFGRLQQGDVLVTRATAPYFNVVLPLLGALVTDRGGQLCHAAIVAREYGIPGVVGTRDATSRIPDGARVRVDGTNGEVHVLRSA